MSMDIQGAARSSQSLFISRRPTHGETGHVNAHILAILARANGVFPDTSRHSSRVHTANDEQVSRRRVIPKGEIESTSQRLRAHGKLGNEWYSQPQSFMTSGTL